MLPPMAVVGRSIARLDFKHPHVKVGGSLVRPDDHAHRHPLYSRLCLYITKISNLDHVSSLPTFEE